MEKDDVIPLDPNVVDLKRAEKIAFAAPRLYEKEYFHDLSLGIHSTYIEAVDRSIRKQKLNIETYTMARNNAIKAVLDSNTLIEAVHIWLRNRDTQRRSDRAVLAEVELILWSLMILVGYMFGTDIVDLRKFETF